MELERHGIPIPEDDGHDLWRDCAEVIRTASEFLVAIKHLEKRLGTSVELLGKMRGDH